ncbi:MAG: AbrB/MazE/SpoVT family DNA-binding domain-containing protein [Planctomycetales bacterium]|nr:AbrB/MazE/SpoVT family DNA-binding domain-containing protein [Planctomycetales bacterium]
MEGNQSDIWNCRIDASGRIVLPLPLRNEKLFKTGDELIVTVEDDAVVLRTYDQVITRLQQQFSEAIPEGVSLVDELIDDRKQEAELDKGR